jgi:hypothetical protein
MRQPTMTPDEARAYWVGYNDGWADGYEARPGERPPAGPPPPRRPRRPLPAGPDYPAPLVP